MIRALTVAAGLAAALNTYFSAPEAKAADLYGEDYRYQERAYEEYEDQRTADRYREEPYQERYEQVPQHGYRGSTKDGDYLPPMERPPRYSEPRYEHRRDRYACAPRWEVRRRLQADGWRNFERLAVRPRVVILRAERPNGRAFDLKLDRCTGEVLAERPSRTRGYGAYGPGPRRFGWAY